MPSNEAFPQFEIDKNFVPLTEENKTRPQSNPESGYVKGPMPMPLSSPLMPI